MKASPLPRLPAFAPVIAAAAAAFAVLTWLCPALCAAPAPATAPAPDPLTALAIAKRDAALKMSQRLPGRALDTCGLGVFIAPDGLALVALTDLAFGVKPTVLTPDGTEIPFGTILAVFPEPELALVKFKHRPKVWVPLASKEPEVGEALALPAFCHENSWAEKVPPVTGPVMSRRSTIGGNLLEPQFRRVLSLGAGFSVEQRLAFPQGSFAINRQGELVAVKAGLELAGRQKFIFLAPVTALAERVSALAKAPKPIPFPLPAASNPIDPVLLDPSFFYWTLAIQSGDNDQAQKLHADLRKRFPKNVRVNTLPRASTDDAATLQDLPLLDEKASPAARAMRLRERAVTLAEVKGDRDAALRELTAAVALCPPDLADLRISLGTLHLQMEHLPEGEALLREAHTIAPESIQVVELLEHLLTREDKIDESRKFTDRLYELERIYRPRF